MGSPRQFAGRSLWLMACLLGTGPPAEARDAGLATLPAAVVASPERGPLEFAEVTRRAKSTGLRSRLLDGERALFVAGTVPSTRSEAAALTTAILDRRRMAAAIEQAHAAANAFCTVRNLEVQYPSAKRIEALLNEVWHDIDAVEAAGGLAGVGRAELERQRDEYRRRKIELDTRLHAERRTLATLIDAGEDETVLPGAGPNVPASVDEREEIETAIRQHPDLAAIEMLKRRLRRDTLPVARRFLALADPSVGLPPPPGGVTGHGLRKTSFDTAPMELRLRAQQLDALHRQRTAAIRLDVAGVVGRFQAAREQRELARGAWQRAVDRRHQLARSADAPGVTAIGLRMAEVEELAAGQQLLEADLRVELAYVHLLAARHTL